MEGDRNGAAPGLDGPRSSPRPPVLHLDWRSGAWIALGLFTTLVLLGLVRAVPTSLTRVGIGVLLALALDPVVGRVHRGLGCTRGTAVAVVGTVVAGFFALLVVVLGPPAIDQAERFGGELPETVEELGSLPFIGPRLEEAGVPDQIREWVDRLPERLDADAVVSIARTALDGLAAALVVAAVGVAALVDGDLVINRVQAALPARAARQAARAGRVFQRTVGAYFAGSLLIAALAATYVLAVGLAFGVPLAPAAALWVLVVNLIPQIGGLLGASFFGLLALTQGVGTALVCVLLYVLYMNLENHVLQPLIIGEAVDLSPAATMLAALVGGAAAGVPGALLATPLVGAGKALYTELRWGDRPGAPVDGHRGRRSRFGRLRLHRRRGAATPDATAAGGPRGG